MELYNFPSSENRLEFYFYFFPKIKKNAGIPYKKPEGGQLSPEQKKFNRELSKKRVKVENVIREIKIFRVVSDAYRKKRKGHNVKVSIIAGIVNMKIEKRLLKKAGELS